MIFYKYIDNHITDVLRNSILKFTSRDNLNDPFELNPYFKPKEYENHDLVSEIGEEAYQEYFLKSLPDNAFEIMTPAEWLVFEKNTRNQENPYKKEDPINWFNNYFNDFVLGILQILNKTFGILSLTEDPLNINMWAHYGNNNMGFVLGFETDNDFFFEKNNPELFYRNLRKVTYTTERPIIRDIFNADDLQETFFCKSTQWKCEKEWRVLRRLDDADEIEVCDENKIHLFKFVPVIVKEIYFGLISDIEVRKDIIKLIQRNQEYQGIKFFQIELDEKEFKLNPKLIKI